RGAGVVELQDLAVPEPLGRRALRAPLGHPDAVPPAAALDLPGPGGRAGVVLGGRGLAGQADEQAQREDRDETGGEELTDGTHGGLGWFVGRRRLSGKA